MMQLAYAPFRLDYLPYNNISYTYISLEVFLYLFLYSQRNWQGYLDMGIFCKTDVFLNQSAMLQIDKQLAVL